MEKMGGGRLVKNMEGGNEGGEGGGGKRPMKKWVERIEGRRLKATCSRHPGETPGPVAAHDSTVPCKSRKMASTLPSTKA